MDRENIKNELISEVEKLLNQSKYKTRRAQGLDKLSAMADHVGMADTFAKEMTNKLNEILVKHKVDFKENEKEEFTQFLKPTIEALMSRYLRN
ncbi:hypothetical protein [Flavobacterium sp. XGLA_31]|uniref:hypothetical protein n=1 Tax=Flavobacterium sp. XGLA_31 TaxID=3447666 RepID=UPI003F3406D3